MIPFIPPNLFYPYNALRLFDRYHFVEDFRNALFQKFEWPEYLNHNGKSQLAPLFQSALGKNPNGELTISIKIISTETLDFDFYTDAVDGISFLDHNGKPSSQAVISGLPRGTGETRLVRFQYTLTPTTIAGDYDTNKHVLVPVREDKINIIYKITVRQ